MIANNFWRLFPKINPLMTRVSWAALSSNNSGGAGTSSTPYFKPTQPIIWEDFFGESQQERRDKAAFLQCIEMFIQSRGKRGGGQIEFIEAAMKNLQSYGVQKELDVYKALLKVFPEGDLLPQNPIQRAFWHYPQHQVCAINLLDEMEYNGVMPDKDLYEIMVARFGSWNHSTKKVKRQLYWMPKLRHTNKYLDRRLVENKKLLDVELARIALKMICRDAGTQITSFKAPFVGAPDKFNWIASAQSPLQKKLITNLPDGHTCFVDGPFRVWVREHKMSYVVLSAPPMVEANEEFICQKTSHMFPPEELHQRLWDFGPQINVHQQPDQTILALAILGVHNNEYASAWLNHLHEENWKLSKVSMLFRLKEIPKSIFTFQRDSTE